jgi:hypothetical protein
MGDIQLIACAVRTLILLMVPMPMPKQWKGGRWRFIAIKARNVKNVIKVRKWRRRG